MSTLWAQVEEEEEEGGGEKNTRLDSLHRTERSLPITVKKRIGDRGGGGEGGGGIEETVTSSRAAWSARGKLGEGGGGRRVFWFCEFLYSGIIKENGERVEEDFYSR